MKSRKKKEETADKKRNPQKYCVLSRGNGKSRTSEKRVVYLGNPLIPDFLNGITVGQAYVGNILKRGSIRKELTRAKKKQGFECMRNKRENGQK